MKTKHLPILILPLAMLASARVANAQNYSIDWFKVAGGGSSAGGAYSISGTIGQHDASAPMTSAAHTFIGGFWAFLSANVPTLKIVPAGPGQVTISWSPNTPGYMLQETITLSPPNWVNSPSGSANPVTVPIMMPAKYYQAFKP